MLRAMCRVLVVNAMRTYSDPPSLPTEVGLVVRMGEPTARHLRLRSHCNTYPNG